MKKLFCRSELIRLSYYPYLNNYYRFILVILICFILACETPSRNTATTSEVKLPEALPLLITDNFEATTFNNWLTYPAENWGILPEDNGHALVLQAPGPSRPIKAPQAYAILKDCDVTDFIFAGKIKSFQHPQNRYRDMDIIFHYQDSTHFYYVHFAAISDSRHNIIALVNGKDRQKINHEPAGSTRARLTDNAFHTFKVAYNSSIGHIYAYLDDMATPILTATDSTLGHGKVGVGSFDDTGCVDDVQLWGKLAY